MVPFVGLPVRGRPVVTLGLNAPSFPSSSGGTVRFAPVIDATGHVACCGCSFINGVLYLFLSWFGLVALIRSVVNQQTIGPIVLFIGLTLMEECLRFLPTRHYAALLFGLFPSIAGEWKRRWRPF